MQQIPCASYVCCHHMTALLVQCMLLTLFFGAVPAQSCGQVTQFSPEVTWHTPSPQRPRGQQSVGQVARLSEMPQMLSPHHSAGQSAAQVEGDSPLSLSQMPSPHLAGQSKGQVAAVSCGRWQLHRLHTVTNVCITWGVFTC